MKYELFAKKKGWISVNNSHWRLKAEQLRLYSVLYSKCILIILNEHNSKVLKDNNLMVSGIFTILSNIHCSFMINNVLVFTNIHYICILCIMSFDPKFTAYIHPFIKPTVSIFGMERQSDLIAQRLNCTNPTW